MTTRSKRELEADYTESQMAETQIHPIYTSTQKSKKVKTEPTTAEKQLQTDNSFLTSHISTQTPFLPLHTVVGVGVLDMNKKLDKILFKDVKDKETQTLEVVDDTTGQFNEILTQNNQILHQLKCVKGVLREYLERE